MRSRNFIGSSLFIFSIFIIVTMFGCGGGGGGGSTTTTPTGGNSVTITGTVSGSLLTPAMLGTPALMPAPGQSQLETQLASIPAQSSLETRLLLAPGQSSLIALKNIRTEQILDQKVTETGTFSFTGEYKGVAVSIIVGGAQNEIIVGTISQNMASNTVIDISQPYKSTGGLNEDAVIASNIIKKLKLETQMTVSDSRPSKLWEYIDQTKVSVDQYIAENHTKTRTSIVAEINQPQSQSFSVIANKMNLTAEKFDHFDIATNSPQKAGGTIEINLTAKDAFGNVVSDYSRNGLLQISGATGTVVWGGTGVTNKGSGSGSFTAATFAAGTAKVYISDTAIDSSKTITITDSTTNKSSTASLTWIDSTQLDRFEIIPVISSVKTAGSLFQVTIRALDVSNNVKTSYNSPVNIIDTTGTITPAVTTNLSNGLWTGNLAITQASTKVVITVSAAGKLGTCEVVVNPGAATKLLVVKQPPSSVMAGNNFATTSASVSVSVCDNYGNVVTTDNSTVITAERGSTGTSSLQGTLTAASIAGTANFTNLLYIKAENIKVRFKSGALASAETGIIEVTPAALHHFDLTSNSPQVAGSIVSLTAIAKDTYGNTITGFNSEGTLAIAGVTGVTWSGKGVRPTGAYDGTGFVSGAATIGLTNTAIDANKTVTIKDTSSSIQATVNVSWISGSFHHFEISSVASPKTAGAQFSITITAKDAFGNTDTTYTAPAALSDTTGTINPTVTGAFVNGAWTGNVSVRKSQSNIVITVTAASRPGNSNTFTVNPDPTINRYVITQVANQIAGAGFFGTVSAKDAYDNTITTNSSVTLTMTTTATDAALAKFYTYSNYITSKPAPVTYSVANGAEP